MDNCSNCGAKRNFLTSPLGSTLCRQCLTQGMLEGRAQSTLSGYKAFRGFGWFTLYCLAFVLGMVLTMYVLDIPEGHLPVGALLPLLLFASLVVLLISLGSRLAFGAFSRYMVSSAFAALLSTALLVSAVAICARQIDFIREREIVAGGYLVRTAYGASVNRNLNFALGAILALGAFGAGVAVSHIARPYILYRRLIRYMGPDGRVEKSRAVAAGLLTCAKSRQPDSVYEVTGKHYPGIDGQPL
jgi:hypothetical protein